MTDTPLAPLLTPEIQRVMFNNSFIWDSLRAEECIGLVLTELHAQRVRLAQVAQERDTLLAQKCARCWTNDRVTPLAIGQPGICDACAGRLSDDHEHAVSEYDDELAALRAERDTLKAERDAAREQLADMTERRDALQRQPSDAFTLLSWQAQALAAEARIARLVEAAKAFLAEVEESDTWVRHLDSRKVLDEALADAPAAPTPPVEEQA